MKMKTIAYLLLGFSAFTLVACSLDKKAKESSKTSGSTSVQRKEHSVNQQIENQAEDKKTNKKQKDAELSYNGSYYGLQGKYEEILIVNKKYPLSSHYNPGENPTAKAGLAAPRLHERLDPRGGGHHLPFMGVLGDDSSQDHMGRRGE